MQDVAVPFLRYWQGVRDTLDRGWNSRGARRTLVRAAIGHAIEFETWRSLTRGQGLDDAQAADAMVALAHAVRA